MFGKGFILREENDMIIKSVNLETDEGVDAIWYPCMSYNNDEGIGDNHFNCPVVAYYPELIAANVPELKKVRYLYPYFGLHRPKDFERKAGEWFFNEFQVPKKETAAAVRAAYDAYDAYKNDLRQMGERYPTNSQYF